MVIANKFICSWGCQFGVLQDFIFRIGRKRKDRGGLVRQIKLPFVVTNGVRVLVFVAAVAVGLLWAFDIVGAVDPFKVFFPAALTVVGAAFVVAVLLTSLYIYRPWCHLACPFGLVSWFFEEAGDLPHQGGLQQVHRLRRLFADVPVDGDGSDSQKGPSDAGLLCLWGVHRDLSDRCGIVYDKPGEPWDVGGSGSAREE